MRYPNEIAYCPSDGTPTALVADGGEPPDPFIGQTVDGRYRIEARIGEGGMGVVYRALHVVLKKPFAIKVMRGEQAHDPEVVQRFVQEARASTAIGHPNIVNISDFGTAPDGSVYFAMEYLQGQTLGKAMEGGRLGRDRAFAIFIQIAGALEAAHERGIIHRDLKPENIFLTREPEHPDFVKILDFGIAKVKNAAAKITRTGMVFGTPHYMSPEQAAGQTVDHRSDIYSLGVIMYQVFAGQLPFESESYMGVMTQHMYETPPPPSQISADLRGPLEDVILKALQKKPELRYSSMLELREDLERAKAGQSVRPVVEPPIERTDPSLEAPPPPTAAIVSSRDDDEPVAVPKRRPGLWLVLVGALLLGLGALSFGALRSSSKPDHAAISGSPATPQSAAAGSTAPASETEPVKAVKPAEPEGKPSPTRKSAAAGQVEPSKAEPSPSSKPAPARKPAPVRPDPAPARKPVKRSAPQGDPWQ
jgi:eukaryotic-like serine/threonine-protein kinase